MSTPHVGVAVALVVLATVSIYVRYRSSRAEICKDGVPCPPVPSTIYGHDLDLEQAPVGTRFNVWARAMGPTYRLVGPFWESRLVVGDPKGANHVLNGQCFERNAGDRAALELFFGRGLLTAEGEEHKRMRKYLSGAFTTKAVEEISDIFFDLCARLKDAWDQKLDGNDNATFDVTPDIHRLTLDAISMSMFMHDFSTSNSDIPQLLRNITNSPPSGRLELILGEIADRFPIVLKLPSDIKRWCDNLRRELGRAARQVWGEKEGVGMHAKLLGSLIDAQIDADEAVPQIIAILFAGSETSANVISECFHEMACQPSIQDKLRRELTDNPCETYQEIMGLSYLDAVVRELTRTKAVLNVITRAAVKDDIIPLQFPLPNGKQEVFVKAGSIVCIPIRDGVNVDPRIWGEDAMEFRPERWLAPANGGDQRELINAMGHVLTFGDGAKTCLGRTFAEIKIVVAVILKRYAFEMADDVELDFYHVGGNTIKPMVRGREKEGVQLPLRVRSL